MLPAPTKTGLIDEFTAMASGEDKILVNSGQAHRFGALIGEQAGLTPSINNIDLDAILQAAMARMQG